MAVTTGSTCEIQHPQRRHGVQHRRHGRPQRPDGVAYDGGNPDVDPNSSCYNPDQRDDQRLSDPGTTNRNVHNDACFLDDRGNKINGPASFQSSGVGFISACPDPDGAGPEFSVLSDKNGDGRNDLCFQAAYQTRGTAGDFEFHARLNNTSMTGSQYVVWCTDADRNGCRDEDVKDDIKIEWNNGSTSSSWSRG
ncbi:MAG: hypothetical protein LH461_00215 [Spirochaetaceae bacterium]|nr:hypothetical protein [Spirochaetaceae bacterium]